MINYLSLINGKFKKEICVLDRGLAYGDGVFETMRWHSFDKNPGFGVEFWAMHLDRMLSSCKLLRINQPSEKIINFYRKKIILKAIKLGMKSGILKILVTRGSGGRGYKFDDKIIPNIIFLIFPMSEQSNQKTIKSVNLKVCKRKLSKNLFFSGMKHLNRLDSVMIRNEWDEKNFFEGIITDENNHVLEGSMTNIFLIKNKDLITPKIEYYGINGIMRKVVLKKFGRFFQNIKETKFNLDFLMSADGIFICNSLIKIKPVKKIENKKIKVPKIIFKLQKFLEDTSNLEIT